MKNLFFGLMAAIMLVATSCESVSDVNIDANRATVSFTLNAPSTRAFSDGYTAKNLQYAVYAVRTNNGVESLEYLPDLTGATVFPDGSLETTVEFRLTTGNKYAVIFWAAAPNAPYAVDFASHTMTVNYTNAVSNDENRDAFYKYEEFEVAGSMTKTIELRRPFAQLNIGANDYAAAKSAGYDFTHSKVVVPVYTTLDLVSGEASDKVDVTFAYAAAPKTEEFPVDGYTYLAMNYLLASMDQETINVKFYYATNAEGADEQMREVGSVPVQRNYRTNLYGQLFTSDVIFSVIIKPEYIDEYDKVVETL